MGRALMRPLQIGLTVTDSASVNFKALYGEILQHIGMLSIRLKDFEGILVGTRKTLQQTGGNTHPQNLSSVENSLLQLIQILNTNIPNTRVKLSSCRKPLHSPLLSNASGCIKIS
ncbi:uncharacterized protein LOC130754227 [Actinidia eriantha]|uniref:uncharacterized protein LOC130754227 n=1 Tax=Actinidia eriantha TaxID=165200 RepID=UPI002588BE17|nr:uncharacterized protein LOC130754227 [Actinidia eriantha]